MTRSRTIARRKADLRDPEIRRLRERLEASIERDGSHEIRRQRLIYVPPSISDAPLAAAVVRYWIERGPVPEGAVVRTCRERPGCIRASHLTLEERFRPTAEMVRAARRLIEDHATIASLARDYGISRSLVSEILRAPAPRASLGASLADQTEIRRRRSKSRTPSVALAADFSLTARQVQAVLRAAKAPNPAK